MNPKLLTTSLSALLAAAAAPAPAQPAPAQPAPGDAPPQGTIQQLDHWFDQTFPDFITQGKVNLNVRLRYEYANQEMRDVSDAFTLRTRLGYTTGDLYGFHGMLEFENVTALGNKDNYNQAGLNPGAGTKTVVADPETTEINRAWISYQRWNTVVKGGRQRIKLDNDRFIGNVGWRQNEQTFDAVSLRNNSIQDLTFFYSWIGRVNRIFGDDHPQGRWNSDSHVLHAAYTPCRAASITGYSYLLDLESSPANASDTYGGFLSGSVPICDSGFTLGYRGEYAYQMNAPRNPIKYHTDYYRVEANGKYDRFQAGAGYEVLGSDGGNKGFGTPLATLHAHNGWADTFLNTPADGLRDLYAWVGVTLPGNVPVKFVYHKFDADDGSNDYGREYDAVISKKFGKYWNLLAKLAVYDEEDVFAGATKAWVQGEFNY